MISPTARPIANPEPELLVALCFNAGELADPTAGVRATLIDTISCISSGVIIAESLVQAMRSLVVLMLAVSLTDNFLP